MGRYRPLIASSARSCCHDCRSFLTLDSRDLYYHHNCRWSTCRGRVCDLSLILVMYCKKPWWGPFGVEAICILPAGISVVLFVTKVFKTLACFWIARCLLTFRESRCAFSLPQFFMGFRATWSCRPQPAGRTSEELYFCSSAFRLSASDFGAGNSRSRGELYNNT